MGRACEEQGGSFNITTQHGKVQGVSHRFCRTLHRSDGYRYTKGAVALPRLA
ncbi:MAG: hypothetical protein M3Y76_01975 [Chloroflexota bacterium]|nr:hypothetical protein [Chloroflexota bacterium]